MEFILLIDFENLSKDKRTILKEFSKYSEVVIKKFLSENLGLTKELLAILNNNSDLKQKLMQLEQNPINVLSPLFKNSFQSTQSLSTFSQMEKEQREILEWMALFYEAYPLEFIEKFIEGNSLYTQIKFLMARNWIQKNEKDFYWLHPHLKPPFLSSLSSQEKEKRNDQI